MLRIQYQNTFACLSVIAEKQFHKIRFTLTAVAKYQNVRVSFVLGSLVKVNKNVSSKLVTANIYAFVVSLALVLSISLDTFYSNKNYAARKI